MSLLKSRTGFNCDQRKFCYLYDPKPANPFACISPRMEYEDCPYFAEHPAWGDGKDGEE